jgi:hypothetical protein
MTEFSAIFSDAPGNVSPQDDTPDETSRVVVGRIQASQGVSFVEWVALSSASVDRPIEPFRFGTDISALRVVYSLQEQPENTHILICFEYGGYYYVLKARMPTGDRSKESDIRSLMDAWSFDK